MTSLIELMDSMNGLSIEQKKLILAKVDADANKAIDGHLEKCVSDVVKECKVQLRPYQLTVVKHMMKHDSMCTVHGTGKGKTLTALATAKAYLKKYPNNYVVVVSPAALVGNFHKEHKKYTGTTNGRLNKSYTFYSFRGFANKDCSDDLHMSETLLIIDEVHNLRNLKSKTSVAISGIAKGAHKVLLLTATPFVNCLGDMKVICNLLYKKDITVRISSKPTIHSTRYEKDLDSLAALLGDKISFENDKTSDDYPSVEVLETPIHMDEEYYKKYLVSLKKANTFGDNPEAFYHGYRRIVNDLGLEEYYSIKLKKVVEIYSADDKQEKTLLFTNWIEFGTKICEEILTENKISHKVIDGSVLPKERLEIVEDFNAGQFNVIIITRAGYEGLDLKGVRKVFILDPVWNPTGYEQIVGRGVRFQSHISLPEEERKVTVYKLVLVPPLTSNVIELEVLGKLFGQSTGDELLYSIMDKKKEMNNEVMAMLKEISL